jgi:serine/threonine protein kinase
MDSAAAAAALYEKIKNKLVGQTYLGHSNTRKRHYFDEMKNKILQPIRTLSSDRIAELDTQPCVLELITIFLRDAKNYQRQNTTAGLLERRITGAAELIVRTLTEGYVTVLKEQLLASITKVATSHEDGNIVALFKDLYTLYYGNCKTGDTSDVDELIRITLFTILPESTELGEFIRNVPTHRSCIGNICSFFSGKKGVRRNVTRSVQNPLAAAAAAPAAPAAAGVGIAKDRYTLTLGDWDRYKPFYEVLLSDSGSATITEVGSGAFGTASKVTMNGETVIVKVMKVNRDTYANRSSISRLCPYAAREANVLQKVTGKHIFPDLYASACDSLGESAVIIMEYIDGTTLEHWLDDERDAAAKEDIKRKLEVVENRLHENKFIHRDLKQDNIMVEKNGEVRLIDAGQVVTNPENSTANFNIAENIDRVQTIKNQINDLITKPNNNTANNYRNYRARLAKFQEQYYLLERRKQRKRNKEYEKQQDLRKQQSELQQYLLSGMYPPWFTPELEEKLTQIEEQKQIKTIKRYYDFSEKPRWLEIGRDVQPMPSDKNKELYEYGYGRGPRPTWLAPVLLQPLWKIQFSFMEPHPPFYIPLYGDEMQQFEVPRMPAGGARRRRRTRRRH